MEAGEFIAREAVNCQQCVCDRRGRKQKVVMAFEIDFLPVGDGERSGDAIALRFGNIAGSRAEQVVMVIDGGTQDSGDALVKHVRQFYRTDYIDYVISTHADLDHAAGLKVVLEEMDFGELLMHRPWEHSAEICDLFKSPRLTASGLSDKLEKAIDAAHELEQIAQRKQRPVTEPFAGVSRANGAVMVLGPSKSLYEELIPHFRSTRPRREPLCQGFSRK